MFSPSGWHRMAISTVTFVRVLTFLSIKIVLLLVFLPWSRLNVLWRSVTTPTLSPLYRIYEQSIQAYLLDDTYYVQVADDINWDEYFADLQRQWVITSYEQPFTALDIPYYRVEFSVRSDQAKRLLSLMVYDWKVEQLEGIPNFQIQQYETQQFGYDPQRTTPITAPLVWRKKYSARPITFTTQQVDDTEDWQWYTSVIWLDADHLRCLSAPKEKLKVAVIDNAFSVQHPNIRQSIKYAFDVADADKDVLPPSRESERMHGSHSVWLLAWKKYNEIWIMGTSLGSADVYVIKATADNAAPTDITHGIEALAKAIELDVDVISLSRWAYVDVPVFRKIVKKALDKWIVIIAAAGNYWDDDLFYPAAYEGVIAVWAYDKAFKRASFSNYWSWVDIYAPGTNLIVPVWKNERWSTDGTSAAAPLFAGVYSFLRRYWIEVNGSLTDAYTSMIEERPSLRLASFCNESPPSSALSGEYLPTSWWDIMEILLSGWENLSWVGIIQQLPTPEVPKNQPEEHFVAPESRVQRILHLFRQRWWWIFAGGVVIVAFGFIGKSKKAPQESKQPE